MNSKLSARALIFSGAVLLCCSCGDDTQAREDAVKQYATIASTMYADSLSAAKAMQIKLKAFTDAPSAANLEAARTAWKDARKVYGETEPLRFYGGPIDSEEGGAPESNINPWPLDENFIDTVAGEPTAGLINDPTRPLTTALLRSSNGATGEKNLTTGWHAIEFLLWGQDTSVTGPGERPYTDFVTGAGGTLTNQDRRRQYLTLVTDLLIEDLEVVNKAWKLDDATSYGAKFVAEADPNKSLSLAIKGVGNLLAGELTRERMNNGYATKEQEEEHSCFSDTTVPIDLNTSITGSKALLTGAYKTLTGKSIESLLRAKDAAAADKLKADLEAAVTAVNSIPAPFDQAILGADDTAGRKAILASMNANKRLALTLADSAAALGLTLDFDYCPEGVASCKPL